MKWIVGVVVLSLAILAAGCGTSRQPGITHDELVRRTQEIMDSVAPGNPEPWKKYFADDGMYFDEKGRFMDKAAFLKDVSPLPNGYSGTIKVVNLTKRVSDLLAISKVLTVFDVFEAEDEAIKSFPAAV